MPNSELILSKLKELPVFSNYERPWIDRQDPDKRNRFWEANENGGHFQVFMFERVYRRYSPDEYSVKSCNITISGTQQSKDGIAADFQNALKKKPISVKENDRRTITTIIYEVGPQKPRYAIKI